MMLQTNKQSGFTLIELMIVIAIIGILASVALPAYSTYTKKAKFSEVVLAASSAKGLIDLCYQTKGTNLLVCATPAQIGLNIADTTAGPDTNTIGVVASVITATGEASVDSQTYILTPTASGGTLTWAQTGSCVATGIC